MKTLIALVIFSCCVGVSCWSGEATPTDVTSETTTSETPTDTPVSEPTTPQTDTSQVDTDNEVLLVWTQTGGCAMAGPNCARFEITADGFVSTYRGSESTAATTGQIEATEVEKWWELSDGTDFTALESRLGPGELTAAFDGVDVNLELPSKDIQLSSVDVEFDQSEPFFKSTVALVDLAAQAAPLEVKFR